MFKILATANCTFPAIQFDLSLSSLNQIPYIRVSPIPVSSLFRFLGVWFTLNCSHGYVQSQISWEYSSFAAILQPAKLLAKHIIHLYNTILVSKLEYHMQVTYLSELKCNKATASIRTLIKHKVQLSCTFLNTILYLPSVFKLINLFAHQ